MAAAIRSVTTLQAATSVCVVKDTFSQLTITSVKVSTVSLHGLASNTSSWLIIETHYSLNVELSS